MTVSIVLLPGLCAESSKRPNAKSSPESPSPSKGHAYTEGFVLNAPAELPDGEYIVIFQHHTRRTSKTRGLWLPFTEIVRHPDG